MSGIFCELYGETVHNQILEYVLENMDIDFAVCDMVKEIGVSKPRAYQIIDNLLSSKIVKKSRIIGGTQLYKLNKNNSKSKILIKHFKDCLKIILVER